MKLPTNVLDTRSRYVAAFPLWSMAPGPPAEDRARAWTLGLISQVCYEHPSQGYGSKRSGPTNPLSKDGLAQQSGGRLLVWDMLSGAGTGAPTLTANPDSQDITGQVFEHVQPRNVIASDGQVDPPTPPASTVIPYDEGKSVQFGLGCNDVYIQSGAAMDAGMIGVHSARAAWDYYVGGLAWPDSYHKHINEFRAVYGLPPV